jgi:hypothetical protein
MTTRLVEKVSAFTRDIRPHGIFAYAYLNLTEHGGPGAKAGDASVSGRLLKASLADALLNDQGWKPAGGGAGGL